VPKERVEPLAASMKKVTEALSQWGIGTKSLLAGKTGPEK
jgi:hypothetical protein